MATELTFEVMQALSNMCEAANQAHPLNTFVASASDLYPVAKFIQGIAQQVTERRGMSIQAKEDGALLIEASPYLYEALSKVIDATRAYLPPDGISKEEFISRVIGATDNARIAEVKK